MALSGLERQLWRVVDELGDSARAALVFVALVVLAVLVFVWAWRGRRMDEHPICRRCRYDLFGSPAERERCPECGAALGTKRAVRIGTRRRRKGWVIAAMMLLLASAGSLGGWGWRRVKRDDWNRYKPVWLLVWEIERSGDTYWEPLWEMERRLRSGEVGYKDAPDYFDRMVEEAFKYSESGKAVAPHIVSIHQRLSARIGYYREVFQYARPPRLQHDPRWKRMAEQVILSYARHDSRWWRRGMTCDNGWFQYKELEVSLTVKRGDRLWVLDDLRSAEDFDAFGAAVKFVGSRDRLETIELVQPQFFRSFYASNNWTPPLKHDDLKPGTVELELEYTIEMWDIATGISLGTVPYRRSKQFELVELDNASEKSGP